jgi:hypothetical protein
MEKLTKLEEALFSCSKEDFIQAAKDTRKHCPDPRVRASKLEHALDIKIGIQGETYYITPLRRNIK